MKKIKRLWYGLLVAVLLAVCCGPLSIGAVADGVWSNEGNDSTYFDQDTQETGDEAFFATGDRATIQQITSDARRKNLKNESEPNIPAHVSTIPPAKMTKLKIDADLCGLVVDVSRTGNFEIDCIGVGDTSMYPVKVSSSADTLTVSITGKKNVLHYVSTVPAGRVNVIRVAIPAGVLKDITVTNKTGCTYIANVGVKVLGDTTNGLMRLQGEDLTTAGSLSCVNGTLIAKGNSIKSPVALSTVNGTVEVEAGLLQNAVLSAINGEIDAEVGTIGGQVSASVTNGEIDINLTKKPTNLTFLIDHNNLTSQVRLPSGWSNGYKVGDGKPSLQLKVANGEASVEVGK